ncbi:MAG TPA: energy-coupling factor transporter transmembrane component T [Actinopolymorphaceae bacterium]|jgi:energy-coupling factor transport system permease protein
MSMLAEPIVSNPKAPLSRLNPVTKLAMAMLITLPLLVAGDIVTPSIVLGAELLAVAAFGVRWRVFVRRLWLVFLMTGSVFVTSLLLTDQRGGTVLFDLGIIVVTTQSILVSATIAVRLLAIALPGVLAFASTDPTEFADALVQHLRTSPRFTFGALAAFRLLPVLADEWRTLVMARRARGIEAGRSPIRRIRLLSSAVFTLLVCAIRRGIRLATAMESRGFTATATRTLARPQPLRPADGLAILATVALVAGATTVSIALGTWRVILW